VRFVDPSLAFAAELEERDAVLSECLALLLDLERRVEEIRIRAEELGRLVERLPHEREQVVSMLAEAERELEAAEQAHMRSQQELERARGEEATAKARRQEAQTATGVRNAEERRARLVARLAELDRDELAAREEIRALEARARELAADLDAAPRVASPGAPAAGLEGLTDWGSRAHPAVLVARSGLETERERVVREANELAASVLGEPFSATSVDVVRKRLEQRLA